MTTALKTLDWKTLLLSPRGRIGRMVFWAGFGVVMAASLVLNFVPFIGGVAGLVLLWPLVCLQAKRLHDAGRTAGLILLPAVVIALALARAVMAGAIGSTAVGVVFDTDRGPVMWILALAGLFALGFLVWVGLSRGERGSNRYGPEPVREAAAA